MRIRRIVTCLMLMTGLCAMAQSRWIDAKYRETAFPSDTYYISYFYLLNEGNLDECVSKTLLGAQSLLANSIFSEVTSISCSSINSSNINGNYSESEIFSNEFQSSASAQLVHLNIEHCYVQATNTVHAIAYVKKQDLSDFCEEKLTSLISSLNQKLISANDFIQKGYKQEAKTIVEQANQEINIYPLYLSQLITIGLAKASPSTYGEVLESILKKIMQYRADLDHSLSIHIRAHSASSKVKGEILSGKCKGILSDNGCSFVDNPEEADYSIVLEYDTRTSSQTELGFFAFADVDFKVTRNRDKTVIMDDSVSVKGGAGTEEKAHRKAIEQSVKLISDKILTVIK